MELRMELKVVKVANELSLKIDGASPAPEWLQNKLYSDWRLSVSVCKQAGIDEDMFAPRGESLRFSFLHGTLPSIPYLISARTMGNTYNVGVFELPEERKKAKDLLLRYIENAKKAFSYINEIKPEVIGSVSVSKDAALLKKEKSELSGKKFSPELPLYLTCKDGVYKLTPVQVEKDKVVNKLTEELKGQYSLALKQLKEEAESKVKELNKKIDELKSKHTVPDWWKENAISLITQGYGITQDDKYIIVVAPVGNYEPKFLIENGCTYRVKTKILVKNIFAKIYLSREGKVVKVKNIWGDGEMFYHYHSFDDGSICFGDSPVFYIKSVDDLLKYVEWFKGAWKTIFADDIAGEPGGLPLLDDIETADDKEIGGWHA